MKNTLKLTVLTAAVFLFLLAATQPAAAIVVFSENFSSGSFDGWSQTFNSQGASQTVSGGIARFTVPTPLGGEYSYSFIEKSGFTSTPNSTITASQDLYVAKVPNSCPQGMGAIFFLYICDTNDLRGNLGNFGVGIDGSGVWSLWIGGHPVYTYLFQTSGALPASGVWYHVVLTVDNSARTVALSVNGVTVVSSSQTEFTDKVHQISLMTGMGECWWSSTQGQQEIDITNVKLDISDATSPPVPDPTTPLPTATPMPTQSPTPQPTPTPTTPPITTVPSTPLEPSHTPNPTQETQPAAFPYWILLPVAIAVAVGTGILLVLKRR
ncbi:MAG: LamG-like jellyroll fold domain-containing protein [Candidatus Bathyarchaeia archaeon]|jgi:hypothetical protein